VPRGCGRERRRSRPEESGTTMRIGRDGQLCAHPLKAIDRKKRNSAKRIIRDRPASGWVKKLCSRW